MELILLALILTIFLMLAPVRTNSGALPSTPAAVCRHVDIDEVRNATPPPQDKELNAAGSSTQRSSRTAASRSMPTIEQDNVETVTYQNKKIVAIARGELLL